MKILCVANEIPLPAQSGGRVDIWRRLQAFKSSGHSVALLCWFDEGRMDPPSDEVLKKLLQVCDDLKVVPILRNPIEIAKRLLNLWRWPSHVAARKVTSDWSVVLAWANAFAPDLIWLDGLYGAAVAVSLSNTFQKQLWYRSHNIEHQYMLAQQARETRWVRRLGLLANCFGLERFERTIMARAVRVFDISLDDSRYWQSEGFEHVEYLPTLVDSDFADRIKQRKSDRNIDLLYFGNLNTPNNVEAVRWLVCEVLPHVKYSGRFVLSGSSPTTAIRGLLAKDNRLELLENPTDMAEVISRARVIVNPMRAGSGVNLKSVEMLFSEAFLVSTSVGVAGLPSEARACFSIHDEVVDFSTAIQAGLSATDTNLTARHNVRLLYSQEMTSSIFAKLDS